MGLDKDISLNNLEIIANEEKNSLHRYSHADATIFPVSVV